MTGFKHLRRLSGVISRFAVVKNKIRVPSYRFSSHLLQGKTVKIGCACGFWGDTAVAGKIKVKQSSKIIEGGMEGLLTLTLSQVSDAIEHFYKLQK